jgi:hypothetical protein
MKYSLRSLMVMVTLVCVVLGGRIEYLRRMASLHERKARHYAEECNRKIEKYAAETKDLLICGIGFPGIEESRAEYYHEEMAVAFRRAVYRPWIPFAEPEECTELRKSHPELNP